MGFAEQRKICRQGRRANHRIDEIEGDIIKELAQIRNVVDELKYQSDRRSAIWRGPALLRFAGSLWLLAFGLLCGLLVNESIDWATGTIKAILFSVGTLALVAGSIIFLERRSFMKTISNKTASTDP